MSILQSGIASLVPETLKLENIKFVKIEKRTKQPSGLNWPNNPISYDDILKHVNKGNNCGVLCGYDNLIVIDFDCGHEHDFTKRSLQSLPETFTVKTRKGFHLYLRCTDFDDSIFKTKSFVVLQKDGEHLGEIRSKGAQVVCPPSIFEEKNEEGQIIAQHNYTVWKDVPISSVTASDLETALNGHYSVSLNSKSISKKHIPSGNDILSQNEYPPSDADLVADKCAFISELRENGLEGNEPAWRAALVAVRHCVNGEEKCHEFSAKSPDYDEALTNQKLYYLKQKDIPPTLCSTLEQYGFCKGCKHKGKVKTPIQLGVTIVQVNEDLETENTDINKNKAKELMKLVPKKNWILNKKGIYRIVDDAPERVTNTPFFIVDVIFETFEDETLMTIVIRYIKNGKVRNFKLPLKLLSDGKKLESEFCGRGIFVYDKLYLKAYICDYVDCLKNVEICKSVNSLGWQSDGSFVYNSKGDTFSKEGESTISVINNNARTYVTGIEAVGSLEKWNCIQSYLKDDVFLPHVFSIMCSMGAPLLNFTDARGIILSLTGASGAGKSLAHEAALSVWGDPETAGLLQVSYTKNAVLGRAGALKNLPLRLDEITKIEPKLLKNLIYELVNGSGRGRSTKDGSFSNVSSNWRTLTLVNANGSLLENNMLVLGEAERNRILELEVTMPANISCIGHDIGKIIKKNYGLAGARLAEEYVKNKPKVLDMLEIYQNKFQLMVEDDKRFWVSCVASALTAAMIANSLGIFNFDIAAMEDWVEKELKTQTETNKSLIEEARGFSTYNEFVTALKDWLTGSILILNEDFTINQSPVKETKARIIKYSDNESILYVRPPILKEFVRLYYIKSFNCVKKELGIGESFHKRFGQDVVRCYEFKMK